MSLNDRMSIVEHLHPNNQTTDIGPPVNTTLAEGFLFQSASADRTAARRYNRADLYAEAGQSLELSELNALTDSYFKEKSGHESLATATLAVTYLNK